MAHPLAYSAECEYKHMASVRINFIEVREKLLELKDKTGIDFTKDLDTLIQMYEKAVTLLCRIQRKTLLEKETPDLLKEVLQDFNILQHTVRTIRRALQKLRLDIYSIKEIDNRWIFDYFEPDFQSLVGNLNEIERHISEIVRAIRDRLDTYKKQ